MNTTVWVALGIVVLVQLTLQIVALVQLVKTPAERVTIGGRKWAWAIIILLGEMVGPILWFIIGRRPAETHTEPTAGQIAAKQSAVDALYGPPEG